MTMNGGISMSKLNKNQVTRELRDALKRRAHRLDLAPDSIYSPAPGAVTARTTTGDLLRLDFECYPAAELSR
jgi:hypothetical protein